MIFISIPVIGWNWAAKSMAVRFVAFINAPSVFGSEYPSALKQ
jgi:hypothetical protein